MPNPHPVITEKFKTSQFKAVGELPNEKLVKPPLAVAVGESIHKAVYSLERAERITWLRRVITDAARRELMNEPESAGLDVTRPLRGGRPNETPSIELEPILKDLEAAFHSGKTLKPTDIKQLLGHVIN